MRRVEFRRLLLAGVLLSCGVIQAGSPKADGLHLLNNVPSDPVLVTAAGGTTLAEVYDRWTQMLARFGGEEELADAEAQLAALEQEIGCSVRSDILAHIGPEYAVVIDLPPIDQLLGAASAGPAGIGKALTGLGMLARVSAPEAVDGCLRKLLGKHGISTSDEDGLVRIDVGSAEEGAFPVYYGLRDGVFVVGPSRAFVEASFRPRASGRRLADGEDYAKVFKHLDAASTSMTYLNLPKVRTLIQGSSFVQGAIASDPDSQRLMTVLMDPEFTGAGIGSTSVAVEGGTRTTYFGPPGLSGGFGGAAAAGIVAAIAIPNYLNAIDRGKQKRTMADLRSAGTAIESFAVDENVYPGPTDGWVPLEQLSASLSPRYIRVLPTVDGWGHALLVWSDGTRYRIVSPGKDGEIERDWSGEIEDGGPTSEFAADIVFGDGSFLVWPEGTQQ